jgi:hypothetical protein
MDSAGSEPVGKASQLPVVEAAAGSMTTATTTPAPASATATTTPTAPDVEQEKVLLPDHGSSSDEPGSGKPHGNETGVLAAAGSTRPPARAEREASFKDFIRVFSYANKWDVLMMVGAAVASIGAGITMPLM